MVLILDLMELAVVLDLLELYLDLKLLMNRVLNLGLLKDVDVDL